MFIPAHAAAKHLGRCDQYVCTDWCEVYSKFILRGWPPKAARKLFRHI